MRRFMDLHISPGPGSLNDFVRRAHELGYHGLGVVCAGCEEPGSKLELASRIDLAPRNQQELMDQLNMHRRSYVVVSVMCMNKSVARQAAKDNRVDILKFPEDRGGKTAWMDRQQAELSGASNCCYEVDAAELLVGDPARLERTLTTVRREIENSQRNDVPVIVSSGATSTVRMRDPRSLASLMDLLGVDEEEALDAVSVNPCRVVERNRDKLSSGYVLLGVKRIE
jgi:ribonuclease P/MRP protein subunit RPP1